MPHIHVYGGRYTQDYDGQFTPPYKYQDPAGNCTNLDWWDDLLQPYVKNRQVAECPSRTNLQGCANPANMWRNGTKPYSYAVNTLESWGVSGWSSASRYGLRRPATAGQLIGEAEIEDPSGTIWLLDYNGSEIWNETALDYVPASVAAFRRHSDGFNAAYVDSHAKWHRAGSTKNSAWSVQSD